MPDDIKNEAKRAKRQVWFRINSSHFIHSTDIFSQFDGIFGIFLPISQRCTFCGINGANISCCARSCRKAYHFTCGSKRNCHFEFVDPFRSYCEHHPNIEEPEKYHHSNDLCVICHDEMGEYHLAHSIESTCCKNKWFHRRCLQGYADNAGYFLKCPCCNNSDKFREYIMKRGIFIPERYAIRNEIGSFSIFVWAFVLEINWNWKDSFHLIHLIQ